MWKRKLSGRIYIIIFVINVNVEIQTLKYGKEVTRYNGTLSENTTGLQARS